MIIQCLDCEKIDNRSRKAGTKGFKCSFCNGKNIIIISKSYHLGNYIQHSKEDYWLCKCGSFHKSFPYKCLKVKERQNKKMSMTKHEEGEIGLLALIIVIIVLFVICFC